MININFNNGTIEDFTIVLSDRLHCHKGQIVNIDNFVYQANLNSANEISFTVYKELDGNNERLWDEIIDLRLVWIKELNEYFEIYVSGSETYGLVKNITGTSLCEAELSQALLRNIEINTEDDIARDDYVVTKFYDSNGEGSLLHRILEKVPHYSIKHVDESLKNLQRTFSINDKSVYDFLTGECAKQFNCLFQFNSVERSISVYDLYTVCVDCGHRGEFNNICPECNSKDLLYYGTDTTIFVSTDNLTDEITYSTDVDSIKNCFKLEAGDDNMTAAVIACNPNGSSYLYYFSDEQKRDMPDELVEKLEYYDALVASYTEEYQEVSAGLYDCIDKIIYYQSEMMPTIEIAEVTASTEAAKLTADNMSTIGLATVSNYTSTATVNSALKNFAKIFVKSGFVKVEIDSGAFTYVGKDNNGYDYGNWTGRFKITNYSDEEDVAYSDTMTIRVTNDDMYYLEQRIKKNISNNDSDDGSIFDVLSITNLDNFKNALTYYCYNRLESFADAIQGVIDILIEEKQSNTNSDYYEQFYLPYYDKLTACQDEMNVRAATIKSYEDREASLIKQRNDIQEALDFEAYVGEELYNIFCSYRREDTYKNDNYISDGLDNAEILRKAIDFIDVAKQEIVRSGEHQHSMSANLYNLLVMKEFAPIVDYFELGNWIRCKFDDSVYRLRLVSYEISGKNLSSINTEFSDMTKTASGVNDLKSIIQDASSMASSYSYVAKQASQGEKAQDILKDFAKDGLNSALINIKNNSNEEVTFDNHGIIARSYDDISDDYSPEQLRITHNILAFTEDNWKTSSLGLGKHDYHYYENGLLKKDTSYGLSSKFVQAGYINGSQIIGGEIYSQNYSPTTGTHINLNDGTFSFAGGKMRFDGSNLIFSGVDLSWGDIQDAPTKVSEFTNDANYANETYVNENLNAYKNVVTNSLANLQSQIDGQIETFFYDYEPTLDNIPASEWITTVDKQKHEGDLFFWKSKGYAYRFLLDGSTWKWQLVQDTDITNALIAAQNAQDTADNKRRVFINTPAPPYDVGDLWVQGDSGDIMRCAVGKTSGSYASGDWIKASKYTDDTALVNFISGDYATSLKNINTQIDGKARSWYQNTDPSTTWNTAENHEGDLWYNTSADSQVTYIYQDGAWKATNVPKSVFDTIDGIASIYTTIPSSPVVNDLLIPTSNITVGSTTYIANKAYKYNGSTWSSLNYTDMSAVESKGYQTAIQVTQITKDTVTSPFIKTLNLSVGNEIAMGENATISWSQVTGTDNIAEKDDIPTDEYITTITKNTITTAYIKALNLEVGNHIKMGENATISWGNVSGKPTDLAYTSDIPTKVSELTNDSQYATTSSIPTKVSQLENDSKYAVTSAIPSKLSQLTNDSGYITSSAVPTDDEIIDLILANRGTIITKDYIGTLKVVAGSVAAENITGTTIVGKTIVVGGENNGNGSIVVKDEYGASICTIDVNGITLKSKKFIVQDELFIISGRYIYWDYAPNLVQHAGGYENGVGTEDTSSIDGYVGGHGHTGGDDGSTDYWGVDTYNISAENYTTLKISTYINCWGVGAPFPYLFLYGDDVLVKAYSGGNLIDLLGMNSYEDQYGSAELDISLYKTIRVRFMCEVENYEDSSTDAWVTVGITSLSLS